MKKYKILSQRGDGSFGVVVKAQNTQNGEIVAIKKMKQKFKSWEECLKLRELKALQKLKDHANIIKLKEIVQVDDELNFVFEFIETNIYSFYNDQKKTGQPLSHEKVKSISFQMATAIKYMHQQGFFHRDLKPENILINSQTGVVKLIDFGLAREIRSRPPFTDYVSTRWYRAPELLLRSTVYNSPVDIFALGLIMAELFESKPIFQGTSDLDQLQKYCGILGTPTKDDWNDGYILANQRGFNFRSFTNIPLDEVLQNTPYEALQLIQECLCWDPQKRPTITKILSHPYFKDVSKYLPVELGGQLQPEIVQSSTIPTQQSQAQLQKPQLNKKDSLNLDDLDDMLKKVDQPKEPQQQQSYQQQQQQQQQQKSNLYNFDNISSQKAFQPYSGPSSNNYNQFSSQNQQFQQQQNSYQTNFDSYHKDRSNRPNSLQNINALKFNSGPLQPQQHSYSPEKKKYSNNQIDLNDKDDDILGTILNTKPNNQKQNGMYF